MFILAFNDKYRVLKSTIVGVLSSDLLRQLDLAVVAFTARHGPNHGLIDFSTIDAIAVPLSRLSSRGRQPQISPGWKRVIVAPRSDLIDWARTFGEYQSAAGYRPPVVVGSLDEAYRALDLTDPIFETVADIQLGKPS